MDITRRRFLETCATSGGVLLASGASTWAFTPVSVENPLGILSRLATGKRSISISTATTARSPGSAHPNDTHMCRLRALCETE